jgi:hypothetical protein
VRDHGPGISVDFKSRIFERFAQADATNARRKGGTGLGLSIAKQIMDRLGGEIGFADAPGGGTIFHFELPIWDDMTDIADDEQIRDTPAVPAAALISLAEARRDRLTLAPVGIAEEVV